jgi:hypothetical protein
LLIILLCLLRTLSFLSRLVIASYSSPVLSVIMNSLYRLFLRKLRTCISTIAASRRRARLLIVHSDLLLTLITRYSISYKVNRGRRRGDGRPSWMLTLKEVSIIKLSARSPERTSRE